MSHTRSKRGATREEVTFSTVMVHIESIFLEVSWIRAESQRGRKGRAPDVMGTFVLGSSFNFSD
jgi:hypothetical protein